MVQDTKLFIEFLRRVFSATGEFNENSPSEIRIGDSLVVISDAGIRRQRTAFLYVYVSDTDATYKRVVHAGARSLEVSFDTTYGDRRCMARDNWSNTWQIATHLENLDES